eukprot:6176143-Pleurochrysis_carterae.AAC.1
MSFERQNRNACCPVPALVSWSSYILSVPLGAISSRLKRPRTVDCRLPRVASLQCVRAAVRAREAVYVRAGIGFTLRGDHDFTPSRFHYLSPPELFHPCALARARRRMNELAMLQTQKHSQPQQLT